MEKERRRKVFTPLLAPAIGVLVTLGSSIAGLATFFAEHSSTSSFARFAVISIVPLAILPAISLAYLIRLQVRNTRSRVELYADIMDDNLRSLIVRVATEEREVDQIFKAEVAKKRGSH